MRSLLFCSVILFAEMFKVGDNVIVKAIKDQYDKGHTVGKEERWVITWDKMTTRHANTFFEQHPAFMENNSTALIVDVSRTPSGIMTLFVLPKMQSYDHPILLSHDETYNRTFPYKQEHITVLFLDNKTVKISYLSKMKSGLSVYSAKFAEGSICLFVTRGSI